MNRLASWQFFALMLLGLTAIDGAGISVIVWLVTGVWHGPPEGYWIIWLVVIPPFSVYFTWLRADYLKEKVET